MIALYDRFANGLSRLAPVTLPTLARLTFAGVLLIYFWNSARTKFGEGFAGLFTPSDGAYYQIFPKAIEAAGYDFSQLTTFHWAVVMAGTWAEVLLPLCIIIGLFTRFAAIGMIGFVIVQSLTDVHGHGVGGDDLGRWFDAASGALILDQRALWITLLMTLVLMGAGPLSVDRILAGRRS
ncbi:DoxX family protein [Defluviimonas sp. WL0050]|uniref:DoxX family protein n=1 Tax=Albidovulum litorale TaxID=2984134 RepID=A0ABT2ZQN7_9RHOB|nr:DoxX family protein [Defluviimonas sp. WL0050]MCV2873432.1 DoxX family protein [Defluviimonas sp. WL0050]